MSSRRTNTLRRRNAQPIVRPPPPLPTETDPGSGSVPGVIAGSTARAAGPTPTTPSTPTSNSRRRTFQEAELHVAPTAQELGWTTPTRRRRLATAVMMSPHTLNAVNNVMLSELVDRGNVVKFMDTFKADIEALLPQFYFGKMTEASFTSRTTDFENTAKGRMILKKLDIVRPIKVGNCVSEFIQFATDEGITMPEMISETKAATKYISDYFIQNRCATKAALLKIASWPSYNHESAKALIFKGDKNGSCPDTQRNYITREMAALANEFVPNEWNTGDYWEYYSCHFADINSRDDASLAIHRNQVEYDLSVWREDVTPGGPAPAVREGGAEEGSDNEVGGTRGSTSGSSGTGGGSNGGSDGIGTGGSQPIGSGSGFGSGTGGADNDDE
ncbi:hypothetical protein HDU79_009558 [Rhizoclosmatium sp. JEL0117]|nr:hypothetical protein HDU79_009558 [Rhizoclosmatium sp. JEL0117]